jgi:carbonic anhydrase
MATSKLMQGYKKFGKHFAENKPLFLDLAQNGQKPQVLWIGCCDSRVNPELIMGVPPGELFVMRNIANIIPPFNSGESSTGAVLEYAIQVLKVQHIVLCGHTDCGGIKALLGDHAPNQNSNIAHWLAYAESILENIGPNQQQKTGYAIEQNVLLQHKHLLTYPAVQKPVKKEILQIHDWIYDLVSGKIRSYNKKNNSWNLI